MSAIFESIQVSDEVKRYVDHSFDIVNRIYDLLEKQGRTQRDLANIMGKKESEISKWMQGTHNFTLKSIAKIESVLGEKLVEVLKQDEVIVKKHVAVFYSNLIMENKTFFKKTEIISQISNTKVTSEVNEIQTKSGILKQKIEVKAGEISFAMAA